MKTFFYKVSLALKTFWRFISYDIWRLDDKDVGKKKHLFYNMLRTVLLAGKSIGRNNLFIKASALTYFTLIAIVPIFGLILGIAKGFGLQSLLENEIVRYFPSHSDILGYLFRFVESILNAASSGYIIGAGILFIIWSTWAIMNNMEMIFNDIWQVPKGRTFFQKITGYLSMMLIVPLLLILGSGASIFIRTYLHSAQILPIFSPVMEFLVKLLPYVAYCILFTLGYILIPHTKVRFKNALIAGVIVGIVFQLFQYLYISGQIWVNRYSAIYGSFAAVPLLLLWLQTTWVMVLFGAEIAFASQNIENFYFEHETKNISHRYRYFISILFMSLLCKRFEKGEHPLSSKQLSDISRVPVRLTMRILNRLVEIGLLYETDSFDEQGTMAYLPAMDIHHITVGLICSKIFEFGNEDFKVDLDNCFKPHWESLLDTARFEKADAGNLLVIDL